MRQVKIIGVVFLLFVGIVTHADNLTDRRNAYLSANNQPVTIFISLLLLLLFFYNRRITRYARHLAVLLLLVAFEGNVNAQSPQTFNVSGTFTVPAGVTSLTVECWGGGGAGGGNTTDKNGAGGGGGGAYSKTTDIAVTPGTIYIVTVGTGGIGGFGTGTNGGNTWFNTVGTILATGGAGGSAPVSGDGGAGGAGGLSTAGVGTTRFTGGAGGTGNNNNTGQGGPGGSSAGTAAVGTTRAGTWSTVIAAAAPAGGGIGGNGGTAGNNGNDGITPGGGGGGAGDGNKIGGNGAAGKVLITWTCPASAGILAGTPTVCMGQSTPFSSSVTGGTWTSGNNSVATINSLTGVISPVTAGGPVTMTYTVASAGCTTQTATRVVSVNALPTANAGASLLPICMGGTSASLGGSVGGGATGGSWTSSAGGTFNPSATDILNAAWTPPAGYAGMATLTLTSSGGSCGTFTDTKTINVIALPTVEIGPAMTAICQGGTSTGLGGITGGSATSGMWTDGGAGGIFTPTPNDLNAAWIPPAAYTGTATLTLTTSGGGCGTTSAAKTIRVNAFPTITAHPVNHNTCAGNSATYSVIVSGTPAPTYQWRKGGSNISGATSASYTLPSVSAADVANYDVVITNSCGTVTSNSASLTISEMDKPVISGCPANITQSIDAGQCNAVVNWIEPSATVNCTSSASLVWTKSHTPGSSFPLGPTIVTYTVTNTANNTSVACSFMITIQPMLTCPPNITHSADAGTCSYTGDIGTPVTNNDCGVLAVVGTRSDGPLDLNDPYPAGVTTITWTASDGTNNSTCTQTITVVDNEPPTFTVPSAITINTSASCTANVNPLITGLVSTKSDNCTPTASLSVAYTDISAPGICNGKSVITRTWKVTDNSGNTTTKTQVITVNDNIPPAWSFIPPQKTIECNASILPANTGQAIATDNCGGSVTVTYSDVTVNGNCAGSSTITRTWKATDCSGISTSVNQTIKVEDSQPPVLTCTSFSVANPNLIPASDSYTNLTATDNCGGLVYYVLKYEAYTGLSGKAGFCPTSVIRKYVAQDQCGNTSAECTQVITVVDNIGCAVCQDKVPLYLAMLDGTPDSLWISPSVKREGLCCTDVQDPNQGCVSFNVYLDKDAAGLIFNINSGAEPSGSLAYQIDCGPPTAVGEAICLSGGRYYTVTFCKPGGNPNTYSIQSISGITGGTGITTRQDARCADTLTVTGIVPASVSWRVKSPDDQTLLRYLSCTNCMNPVFTPDKLTPPTIVYEVCGILPGTNQCTTTPMTDCNDITVVTLPAIIIAFDINLGNICADNIPTINAAVSPINPDYNYQWHDAPDGNGTLLSTDPSWKPVAEGSYSLVVTENVSGIQCNSATYNFNITFDVLQPTILAPPQPLVVQCNDPQAAQQIVDWLSTASASDGITNVVVTNNYNGITMACGQTITVTFNAIDQCGNVGIATSTISVIDTQSPTWQTATGSLNRTLLCTDAAGLTSAQTLVPTATDLCGPTVILTKTTGAFVPGSCSNSGSYTNTWTATDDCGNISGNYTQVISVQDTQAPTWITAVNALNTTIGCTDAAGLAAAQALVPLATDNCDVTLSPVKVTGNFVAGSCPQTGSYTNTWTVSDDCGNVSGIYTQVITITDNQAPVFSSCPTNLEELITDGGCSKTNVSIPNPVFTDNCPNPILTWTLTGATSESGTGLIPSNQAFNVGKTQVNFTLTDASGNTAFCSFQIWIKNLDRPRFQAICPATPTTKLVGLGLCSTYMTVPSPEIINPCNEAYTIINDSPFKTSLTDASGSYPVGTTVVNWTVTDASGKVYHCPQTVNVIDDQFPVITCQSDIEETISSDNCAKTGVAITSPGLSDNCPNPILTWTLTGATIGNGTDPITASQSFNIGKTRIHYTLTDASGNKDTCSFQVWVKSLNQPKFKVTCPAITLITSASDVNHCYASVVLDPPGITNPCSEAYTMVNSFNATNNASGHYPIGTTIVNWTVTDASGTVTLCTQTVTVTDLVPILACPANINANADFEQPFATGIAVPLPTYSDNCPGLTLTWVMTGATTGSSALTGENTVPSPRNFNVGVTTITYTLTDANAHTVTCSFIVTVESKPDIDCLPPVSSNTDPGLCTAAIDPGLPTLLSGAMPVVWTWALTGATIASGTGAIGTYNFNAGLTTITWTATNVSGADVCTQTVNVSDKEPPTFTATGPFEVCVENLLSAVFASNMLKINPDPDYSLFRKESTIFDLDPTVLKNNFIDNCCADNVLEIHWRIDFTDIPNPAAPPAMLSHVSVSGTGQPSAYGSDIKLFGDGVNYTNIIHKITYWLVDCNGNKSMEQAVNITIRPRPRII